jgi:hypothetical protein
MIVFSVLPFFLLRGQGRVDPRTPNVAAREPVIHVSREVPSCKMTALVVPTIGMRIR